MIEINGVWLNKDMILSVRVNFDISRVKQGYRVSDKGWTIFVRMVGDITYDFPFEKESEYLSALAKLVTNTPMPNWNISLGNTLPIAQDPAPSSYFDFFGKGPDGAS